MKYFSKGILSTLSNTQMKFGFVVDYMSTSAKHSYKFRILETESTLNDNKFRETKAIKISAIPKP